MPNIPAICDDCIFIFPSGFHVENSGNVQFSNCSSGPCPRCGNMGHIPDGVYNVFDQTIEIISNSIKTKADIGHILDHLRMLKHSSASEKDIKESIAKDVPQLSNIIELIPQTRSDWYAFLSLLIATFAFMVQLSQNDEVNKPDANVIVNNIYTTNNFSNNNITNNNFTTYNVNNSTVIPNEGKRRKTGRNEPCSCNSGIKYKKCHGR